MNPFIVSYAYAAGKKFLEVVERPPNHTMRTLLLLTIVLVTLALSSVQTTTSPAVAQAPAAPASAQTVAQRPAHHRNCGSMRPNATTPASLCMAPPEHNEARRSSSQ